MLTSILPCFASKFRSQFLCKTKKGIFFSHLEFWMLLSFITQKIADKGPRMALE